MILSAVIVVIELLRHSHGWEGWTLASLLAGMSLFGLKVAGRLRDHSIGTQRFMAYELEQKTRSKHSISMSSFR